MRTTLGLVPAACAVLLLACGRAPAPPAVIEFSGPTMGTTWSVRVVPPGDGLSTDTRRAIDDEIRDELVRIDQLMSTWKPESELSRFNASVSTERFPVAPETFDVFAWSRTIHDLTAGAFDPTIAPLIDAWGFGVNRAVEPPDDARVERLRAATGMDLVELDPNRAWVRKTRPDVHIDFSAIAPGYAADRIAGGLVARRLDRFLVDVGGELVASGRNDDGQPWQVGIERPQETGRAVTRVVPVTDRAIATSGDYRNFREVEGRRLTHILDPRTGRPVSHALASVTVMDDLAVRADALATALMVMGPDEAAAFADERGIAALFLIRLPDGSFEERRSAVFAGAGELP